MIDINDAIAMAINTNRDISVIVVAGADFDKVRRDEEGRVDGVPVVPSKAEWAYVGTYAVRHDWSGRPVIEMIAP